MSDFNQIKAEREHKLALLKEKQEQQKSLVEEANRYMDQAKAFAGKKDFDHAGEFYQKAAAIFKDLHWDQQVTILQQEVQNMQVQKHQIEEKQNEDKIRQQQQEAEYNARAQQIIEEKQRSLQWEEEQSRRLPPEIQRKYDEAASMRSKADLLAEKGKLDQALARYEFLISYYIELNADPHFITEIQVKIDDLQKRMPHLEG